MPCANVTSASLWAASLLAALGEADADAAAEVVLDADQTEEEGTRAAREVMHRLGLREEDLVGRAYLDLLLDQVD